MIFTVHVWFRYQCFTLTLLPQNFKREEQNFVVQNEINNMSFLIMDSKCKISKVRPTDRCRPEELIQILSNRFTSPQGIISDQERKKMKKKTDKYSKQTSLIVATLKRLLPVGMNTCAPGEQQLVTLAKNRFSEVQNTLFRSSSREGPEVLNLALISPQLKVQCS